MSLDSILRSIGKNLFNINTTPTFTHTGATYAVSGTTITFKSNNTTNNSFYYSIPVEIGKTYTVSVSSIDWDSTSLGIFLSSTNAPDSNNYGIINKTTLSKTFTANANTLWIHGYLSYSAGDFTFTFDKLQVEEGSVATTYESYQQGPKSIKIGDKEVLKVSYGSRNLWQNTNTTFPAALSYNSTNQTYTLGTGTTGYNFVAHTLTNPIPAGTTVTISVIFQSGKGNSVSIGGYHHTGGMSWQGNITVPPNVDMTGQTLTGTFNTTETVEEFMVFHNTGDNIEEPFIFKVQYELGDKKTDYVPYFNTTVWTKKA